MTDTTMIDIYEAAGCIVSEDRTTVHNATSKPNKPFKIELLVVPTGWSGGSDEPDMVTFDVLLHDEHSYHTSLMGTMVTQHDVSTRLKLPVGQVKIIKESKD